jgi:hypothetical protein
METQAVQDDRRHDDRPGTITFVAREMARRRDRPRKPTRERHAAATHEDREISRRGHLVHKLKAKDSTGRWAYYVLLISPRKERIFTAALKAAGSMDLASFGTILASNYGEEPSTSTRTEMKRRFGFDV